jgi:hypothetical protein
MAEGSAGGERRLTPRRQAQADSLLNEALRSSGTGKPPGTPLHLQSSPMPVDRTLQIGGLLGPPAWSLRLKRIEDGRAALDRKLEAAWGQYARRYAGQPEEFARRWRAYIDALDLTSLNTLIEKHNRYYVIEARIPVAYPSGEYVIPMGIEYPQRPVQRAALLEAYPPDVDMALYFTSR